MRDYCRTLICTPLFSFLPIVYAYDTITAIVIPVWDGGTLQVPAGTEILINCHCLDTVPAVWGSDAQEWRALMFLPRMTFLGGSRACM